MIIQTPTLVVVKSAMKLFKGLYGKRCILNVSDIWPLTAVDMGAIQMGSRSWKYMEGIENYLYRKADGVFGQSEEILNHVAAKMNTNLTNDTNRNKTTDGTDLNPDSEAVLGSEMWKEEIAGRLRDMPAEDFQAMSARCIEVSRNELDFEKQMKEAYEWLEERKR